VDPEATSVRRVYAVPECCHPLGQAAWHNPAAGYRRESNFYSFPTGGMSMGGAEATAPPTFFWRQIYKHAVSLREVAPIHHLHGTGIDGGLS